MSEAESRSPDRTSFDDSDKTTTENSTRFVTAIEATLKNSDLRNSTSDNNDESESEPEPEDDPKQEVSDETCSRARPYVRGRKPSGQTSASLISSGVRLEALNISSLTVPMPVPPEEPDALLTTTLTPKYATPIETPDDNGKIETTLVPESLQTELQSSTITIKCDDIKGSPDQKRDSESEGKQSEASTRPISTDPANPSEASPKTQHKRILDLSEDLQPITNKSVSCHKNTNLGTTGSRKGSKIPVGIAVAWQRLVTGMSTAGSSTTSVTSAPSIPKETIGNDHKLSELPCPTSPIKIPLRPSSASSITPIKISSTGKEVKVKRGSSGCGDSVSVHTKRGHNSISRSALDSKSCTPELTSVNVPSRPLPSSSVPPNLGLSYLHGSLMEYHYGMRSATPFQSLSSHHHGHGVMPPSWPQASAADLSVPQGFNSPGAAAAYLQQTMHNQMQLQQQLQAHHHSYSNYPHPSASYLHPGFETLRQQYEQLILHNHQQQQHSELLRQYHHHHQQQQYQHQHQQLLSSSRYDSQRATPTLPPSGSPRISIPILSPSPTGGVRTPTPTTKLNPSHHSLSLSNLSTAGVPNWPAELYHHNSSIALSPKSLTSSTPSPVTVQHDFSPSPLNLVNSIGGGTGGGGGGNGSAFLGRKSASPNPVLSKTFPLAPSPVTSSRQDLWKDVTTTQARKKHLSTSADKHSYGKDETEKSRQTPDDLKPKSNGKLEHDSSDDEHFGGSKKWDIPLSPLGHSQSPHHRHDFTRMESLIEKRVQESVQLLNQEEVIVSSKPEEANDVDKGQENTSKDDMKHLVVKVETDLDPKFQLVDKHGSDEPVKLSIPTLAMIKSYPSPDIPSTSPPQKPSLNCKKTRKPKAEKLGKRKTAVKVKKVRGESKLSLPTMKGPKISKKPKNQTAPESDKPKSLKQKKELRQPGKESNPPVVKHPKKPKELRPRRIKSDDLVTKSKKKKREDYKIMIGNVVPDLTLPVASSVSTTLSDNISDKPNLNVGLSQESAAEKVVVNGNSTVLLVTGASREADDIMITEKFITAEKAGKYFLSEKVGLKVDDTPQSMKKKKNNNSISSISCVSDSNPDNNPVSRIGAANRYNREEETKYNNSYNSCNNIYASQSNVTSDDQMKRDSTTSSTATVIITNPNQSIPLCGGNTISLNPLAISPARVSIIPNPVTSPGIHGCSPVTLFLPRILPESTINSQQTSFKLVVSSQDIKIPAFVPSINEGPTVQFYQQPQQHQQNYSTTTTLQNVNLVASSSTLASPSTSSSLHATLCDSESSSSKNMITIITPATSPPSSATYQIRQTILPTPTPYVEPIHHQQEVQQSNIFMRKDFIETGENHLNLLAAVAQEFGARDDLGKLKISTSSSTSTSFITTIGSANFHPNLQCSISEDIPIVTKPIVSMQSPEIPISTPPPAFVNVNSPLPLSVPTTTIQPKHTAPKTSYDEYEYDEKEQTVSEPSPGSYKQAVWLKIPQVIPKAATKVAEKLLKAQRKQEKVLMKVTSKKPKTPKKKRDNLYSPAESVKSRDASDNTQTKAKVKPITRRGKGSPNKALNKIEPKINEKDTLGLSKLKIPKIPESLTKLPVKRKESRSRSRSPEKSEMQQRKKSLLKAFEHSTYSTSTMEPISMKMTLPVPKVAKIRIKLSETEEPTLLRHKFTDASSYPITPNDKESIPNGNKKGKIKRRHSDGDKLSPKKKHRRNHHSHSQSQEDKSLSPTSDLIQHKTHKRRKRSHEQEYGNPDPPHSTKTSKVIKTKRLDNVVSETTSKSTAEDLSSSFTSLTPPPTAKPLFQLGSSPHSSEGVCHPIFSPSNLENENETETENENENDFNWVADPTFAVSAIRLSNTTNHNHKGPAGHSRDNATSGALARKSEKKDKRKSCKPSKLSLLNLRNQAQQLEDNTEKDLKSQLKSFVHFAPKRVISGSKSEHRHIKPCLKAEPIVRPLSSLSGDDGEEEDSDAEIDLEVATLTKSISPTHKSSFYQPNLRKSQHQQAISNSNSIKNASQSPSKAKRRSSSTHSSKQKNFSRRLSLNLDRPGISKAAHHHDTTSEEEELPDIDEDYPTTSYPTLPNPSQSTSGQSSETENKQISNSNHVIKESGSGSGSSSFWQPKRLPKKRSSRSSTATSTASEKPVSASGLSRSLYSGESSAGLPSDILEDETLLPGKIELESVAELLDEMRILTEIQGLFYTGKLNALQPPDVYGVTLDNERGAPPHLIFSAEEVLEKCIREKKPQSLTVALRICAYWSPQYSGLYPGRVSTDFNPHFDPEKDLIPIEFDDGDTGMIKLGEIRLLPANHPIRAYEDPLLTLEKKHRKRRHSSTNTSSGPCTGDHDEADCGESFCAKVGKYEEEDDELKDTHHPFKSLYWTWTGLGYKRPKSKKNRNKEFFRGIQRGDEVINVGDSAIFISHGNERPYIGRVERFWEKKGQKVVNVRWFYHPEEVKSPRRIPHLKHPGALFESPHIDENDVQTIAKKCDVLPLPEFKERIGRMPKLSLKNSTSTKPRDLYYVAGYYDPYTYNLQLKI